MLQTSPPLPGNDTALDNGPQSDRDMDLPPAPKVVDPARMRKYAAGYPDATVRRLGIECAEGGLDPGFVVRVE